MINRHYPYNNRSSNRKMLEVLRIVLAPLKSLYRRPKNLYRGGVARDNNFRVFKGTPDRASNLRPLFVATLRLQKLPTWMWLIMT